MTDEIIEPQVTLKDTVTLLRQEIDRLQKQNEIMRKALAHYAKIDLWTSDNVFADESDLETFLESDEIQYIVMGKRARQALKDCEEI